MNNLNFISPEIFISLSIMFLLILGVFKKKSSNLIHYLSIVSLLIVLFLVCHSFTFTQTRLHCTLFIICKTRIVSVISIVEEQSV